jgi:hypothetical protein
MVPLTINNFLIYFCIAWGANISLNFLYILKRYVPGFKILDYPMDFKLNYKGDRLFGDSVNIIGLIVCAVISLELYLSIHNLAWSLIPTIVYFGNLIGSFIKRRAHKKSGEFMPLIDHGDYMLLLGIIFASFGYISFWFALLGVLVTYILHPIACVIAFKLKLRARPY